MGIIIRLFLMVYNLIIKTDQIFKNIKTRLTYSISWFRSKSEYKSHPPDGLPTPAPTNMTPKGSVLKKAHT